MNNRLKIIFIFPVLITLVVLLCFNVSAVIASVANPGLSRIGYGEMSFTLNTADLKCCFDDGTGICDSLSPNLAVSADDLGGVFDARDGTTLPAVVLNGLYFGTTAHFSTSGNDAQIDVFSQKDFVDNKVEINDVFRADYYGNIPQNVKNYLATRFGVDSSEIYSMNGARSDATGGQLLNPSGGSPYTFRISPWGNSIQVYVRNSAGQDVGYPIYCFIKGDLIATVSKNQWGLDFDDDGSCNPLGAPDNLNGFLDFRTSNPPCMYNKIDCAAYDRTRHENFSGYAENKDVDPLTMTTTGGDVCLTSIYFPFSPFREGDSGKIFGPVSTTADCNDNAAADNPGIFKFAFCQREERTGYLDTDGDSYIDSATPQSNICSYHWTEGDLNLFTAGATPITPQGGGWPIGCAPGQTRFIENPTNLIPDCAPLDANFGFTSDGNWYLDKDRDTYAKKSLDPLDPVEHPIGVCLGPVDANGYRHDAAGLKFTDAPKTCDNALGCDNGFGVKIDFGEKIPDCDDNDPNINPGAGNCICEPGTANFNLNPAYGNTCEELADGTYDNSKYFFDIGEVWNKSSVKKRNPSGNDFECCGYPVCPTGAVISSGPMQNTGDVLTFDFRTDKQCTGRDGDGFYPARLAPYCCYKAYRNLGASRVARRVVYTPYGIDGTILLSDYTQIIKSAEMGVPEFEGDSKEDIDCWYTSNSNTICNKGKIKIQSWLGQIEAASDCIKTEEVPLDECKVVSYNEVKDATPTPSGGVYSSRGGCGNVDKLGMANLYNVYRDGDTIPSGKRAGFAVEGDALARRRCINPSAMTTIQIINDAGQTETWAGWIGSFFTLNLPLGGGGGMQCPPGTSSYTGFVHDRGCGGAIVWCNNCCVFPCEAVNPNCLNGTAVIKTTLSEDAGNPSLVRYVRGLIIKDNIIINFSGPDGTDINITNFTQTYYQDSYITNKNLTIDNCTGASSERISDACSVDYLNGNISCTIPIPPADGFAGFNNISIFYGCGKFNNTWIKSPAEFVNITNSRGGLCGNSIIDDREECDSANLDGKTCASFGLTGNGLKCDGCRFNTTNCIGNPFNCGNGIIDPGETCDGTNITLDCSDIDNYIGGEISCYSSCHLDETNCLLEEQIGEGIGAYWANMRENLITRADINDTVKMIWNVSGFPDGKLFDFDVYEDDWLINNRIRTGANAITGIYNDSEKKVKAVWKITDLDIKNGGNEQESEFYFVIRDGTTEVNRSYYNLLVNESGGGDDTNSAPVAVITTPANGEIYDINTVVSFNQLSYDIDDYFNYTWDFGDGENAQGSTRTMANWSALHEYGSNGTMIINLSARDERGKTGNAVRSIVIINSSSDIDEYFIVINIIPVEGMILSNQNVTLNATESWVIFYNGTSKDVTCIGGYCPATYSTATGIKNVINTLTNANRFDAMYFNWSLSDRYKMYGNGWGNASFIHKFYSYGQHYADLTISVNPSASLRRIFNIFDLGSELPRCITLSEVTYWQDSSGLYPSANDCHRDPVAPGSTKNCCPLRKDCISNKCEITGSMLCSDYADENKCLDYTQAVAENDVFIKTGYRLGQQVLKELEWYTVVNIRCEWNSSTSLCEPNYDLWKDDTPFDTCTLEDAGSGECEAGLRYFAWTGVPEIEELCESGEMEIPCGMFELGFFSIASSVIFVLLLIVFYVLLRRRKNKKKKETVKKKKG